MSKLFKRILYFSIVLCVILMFVQGSFANDNSTFDNTIKTVNNYNTNFSPYSLEMVIDNSTESGGIKNNLDYDILTLESGIYSGANNTNITIDTNKNLIIQSQDPNNKAIIDCESISWFIINQGNLTLKNLIIQNGFKNNANGSAIYNSDLLTI